MGTVVVEVVVEKVVVAWMESMQLCVLQQQDESGHDPQGEY